jgi:hypothetical protein
LRFGKIEENLFSGTGVHAQKEISRSTRFIFVRRRAAG